MAGTGKKRRGAQVAASPAGASPRSVFACAGLVLAVLASAFGVIHSTHQCRQLYAQLQVLEASQWYLQENYSRLLIQESTLASHYRVEKVAGTKLGMQSPAIEQIKVVRP